MAEFVKLILLAAFMQQDANNKKYITSKNNVSQIRGTQPRETVLPVTAWH
jgi:hypothetical protein